MKKIKFFFLLIVMIPSCAIIAQVGINTDGTSPDATAMLDVKSTDKGLLMPRLTQAQIAAIVNPADGLQVYNSDYGKIYVFVTTDNEWKEIAYGAGTITPPWICGTSTITDSDGNIYNTVLIGTQCWMKENLATTKYNNSIDIPLVTDGSAWAALTTPAYCWYNNDQATYAATYGALYNWYTVNTGNLCPTGWHIPNNDEWQVLTDFISDGGSVNGNKLKSCRQINSPLGENCSTTEHPRWDEHNIQYGTDNFNFSGLPGSYRGQNGLFNYIGAFALWWSITESSTNFAWYTLLYHQYNTFTKHPDLKVRGHSVRCIKD